MSGTKTDEDDRRIVTDGGRDTPGQTVPDNGGLPLDFPKKRIGEDEDAPQPYPATHTPHITAEPDDSDDLPTVTACMDCLAYYPTASESWERCPKCGSGLADVEPAGDSV